MTSKKKAQRKSQPPDEEWSLGCDMGRKFGYALFKRDQVIESGVWDLGPYPQRDLVEWLVDLWERRGSHECLASLPVCAETLMGGPSMRSVLISQAKYLGILEYLFDTVSLVHPLTLRKFIFSISKDKKKEHVLKAAQTCWQDQKVVEQDHADALWLGAYCYSGEWRKAE